MGGGGGGVSGEASLDWLSAVSRLLDTCVCVCVCVCVRTCLVTDWFAYPIASPQAISSPSDDAAQTAAWDAVCPLVGKLKLFHDYAFEMEAILPVLLEALCTGNPVETLEAKQALAKLCAELLSFVLKFDDLKMNNPAIQNDFSYYRRTLSRMKMKDPVSS